MKLQLAVVGLLFGTVLTQNWNYNFGQIGGPDDWVSISDICNDQSQSPINIDTTQLLYDESLAKNPFVFDNYDSDKDINFTLGNNGHSVELLFEGKDRIFTGGNLPGEFRLFQIHFHWGSSSYEGSEHALDNQFYPMEMHMVHHNTQYSIAQSLTSKNGLAVLGFFFKISQNDNPAFDHIVNNLKKVIHKGQIVGIPTIPLFELMSNNLDHFYRYSGSLTTPNCYETVTWTVFDEPIVISERQMTEFREILEGEVGDPVKFTSNNFRPIQNLNGRPVYTTIPWLGQFDPAQVAGSGHIQASISCLLLSALSLLVVR